ncbi:MAG: methyltransferase domain-containing protein [Betaproteobacteria bacterium]|nr:methyltransferase domain-containing protein [Betaproteobacteria bacterium]
MEAMPRTDWPTYAAASGTHEKVLQLATALLPQGVAGLSACDVPCGSGSFSLRLAATGIQVAAVDIAPADHFVYDPGRRILHDCNLGLPFADASLDLVISIEGIDHMENP